MKLIKVYFEGKNGEKDSITTRINGTPEEISAYYLNNWFNLGTVDDCMMRAYAIDFLNHNI